MSKVLLIHSEKYQNWVFSSNHPTQGRRFQLAADSLIDATNDDDGIEIIIREPKLPKQGELELVHDSEFISDVLTKGISWEWEGQRADLAELASLFVGGTLAALNGLITGEASVAVNFPGAKHHAQRSNSSGFCVFHDFAIAAKIASASGYRVAIFDLDAHHGDGTQELLRNDYVLTYSVHDKTIFPGTGFFHEPEYHIYNKPLDAYSGDIELNSAVAEFNQLATKFGSTMIFIAAGADGHTSDPLSTLNYSVDGIVRTVQAIKSNFPNTPFLIGGAGGYQPDTFTPEIWSKVVLGLAKTSY